MKKPLKMLILSGFCQASNPLLPKVSDAIIFKFTTAHPNVWKATVFVGSLLLIFIYHPFITLNKNHDLSYNITIARNEHNATLLERKNVLLTSKKSCLLVDIPVSTLNSKQSP
ncbi:hypothetical protein [Sporosarcina sp. 6E9]|uniref:hypothetical protein n=1 Tax=Sporosarcina sp. 6E9 TaxID=2819235 RepID=UPI001B317EA8|nr:hypothetical protein [Sporosarcina sp. 6E9]